MAIGFINSSFVDAHVSSGGGSGTTQVIGLPAGVSASSIVVACFCTGASTSGHTAGSWTGPTGWTTIAAHKEQANGASTIDLVAFWALGSVPNLTFTINGTNFVDDVGVACLGFSGVDLITPIDAAGTAASSISSGTVTGTGVTIATANAWLCYAVGQWLGGAYSATGFTVKANAGANQSAAMMYNSTGKATGATGTTAIACSGSTTGQILIATPFALRPAASAAPPSNWHRRLRNRAA